MSLHVPILSLLLTFTAGLLTAATPAKPNILFVLSDDHSYPFLSCYGDPNVRTPTLDKLAAEGMKFHRLFTVAPQCVPSRAGYLTGRSAVAARMTRFSSPLPRDEITFPEILRAQAGYFTGVCGRSYHLDGSNPANGPTSARLLTEHGLRTFEQRVDYLRTGSDTAAIEQMREFLAQKPAEKPFCLWLNFSDPHHAWTPSAEDRPDPAQLKLPAHWPDLPGIREQLADYCGEVNRVDRSMKAVLDLLAERGFAANTLVVFAGDNGAALPHGKGSLYDPGSNVPLVIRWPGIVKPGGDSRSLLIGEDFAPTLLAAAGLRTTYFTTPRPVYELYDLDADPSELNNLSGQTAVHAIELELRTALAEKMIVDFDYLPLPDLLDRDTSGTKAGKAGKNGKKKL